MRVYLLIMFLFVCPLAIAQQANPLPIVQQKMQALQWLTGKWKGTVHINGGDGNKQEFNHALEFANKLNSTVLLINETMVQGQNTIAQNIGLLGYDVSQSKYNLQAYTKDGAFINADVEALDKKMIWHIHFSGRIVQYTATLNEKGQWHQIGEISSDEGKTWNNFFESTLTRLQ